MPKVDHFEAVGIPLTEFSDSNPTMRNPYQLADIVVTDASSGAELARTQVVVPTSSEMRCDRCHAQDGIANTQNNLAATGNVAMNILMLHDAKFATKYPAGHDVPLAQRAPCCAPSATAPTLWGPQAFKACRACPMPCTAATPR